MAQAISTKYRGPTNTRGSRVLVKSWQGTTYFEWDYALESTENHAEAIHDHIKRINENTGREFKVVGEGHGPYHHWMGSNPDGTGYTVVVI